MAKHHNNFRLYWMAICLLANGFLFGATAQTVPMTAPVVYPEMLHYTVHWAGLLVGEAQFVNHGWVAASSPTMRIEVEAKTSGAIEYLYKAREKYFGILDSFGRSRFFEEWYHEKGNWHRHSQTEFFPDLEYLVRKRENRNPRELAIRGDTLGPFGAYHYFRTTPLVENTRRTVSLTEGKDLYEIVIEVGRRSFSTNGPQRTAVYPIVFKPYWNGNLMKRRIVTGQVTADSHQIPLYLEAATELGTISARLVRYSQSSN